MSGEMEPITREQWNEYLTYLDELRDSGETNMFGAGAYVQSEFGLGRREARTVVTTWMETYDPFKSITERVDVALSRAGLQMEER